MNNARRGRRRGSGGRRRGRVGISSRHDHEGDRYRKVNDDDLFHFSSLSTTLRITVTPAGISPLATGGLRGAAGAASTTRGAGGGVGVCGHGQLFGNGVAGVPRISRATVLSRLADADLTALDVDLADFAEADVRVQLRNR